MSLTAISSLESARRKVFMNSTYIMSRKKETNVFKLGEAQMSLRAIRTLESARRKFFMKPTYIMSIKEESNVFGLSRPK